MALRSTYGSGVYNSGEYGVPETTQAAVTAAVSVSVSADAVKIVEASCTASVDLAASNPTPVRVALGSAAASLNGIMSVSAVKYDGDVGFRSGYGISTYGTFVYGENYSTKDASASASVATSVSCAAVAIRQSGAAASVDLASTSKGFMSIVGASSSDVSILPRISYNRVRLVSVADDISATAQVFARYKWINASEPTTIWAEADYLERAV